MSAVRYWSRGPRRVLALALVVIVVGVLAVFAVWPFYQAWERQQDALDRLSVQLATSSEEAGRATALRETLGGLDSEGWRDLVIEADNTAEAFTLFKDLIMQVSETAGLNGSLGEPWRDETGVITALFETSTDQAGVAAFIEALAGQANLVRGALTIVAERGGVLTLRTTLHAVWVAPEAPL